MTNNSFKNAQRIGFYSLLLIIILVGIILRFYRIGKESFWFDEIYAIKIASFNFWNVISGKTADPGNPPLFFAILSLWGKHFGLTELTSRIPAAIFSLLTFPFIFLAARVLYKKKTFGILATTFFSISLFSILYAQEARSYSLFVFLTTLSLWLQSLIIFKSSKTNEILLISIYLIIVLLGLYTHYLYFYVLFLQGIIWGVFLFLQKRIHLFLWLSVGLFLILYVFLFSWGRSHLLPAIFSENRGYDINKRVGYDFQGLLSGARFSLTAYHQLLFNNMVSFIPNLDQRISNLFFMIIFVLPVLWVFIFFEQKQERKIILFLGLPILLTLFLALFTPFGILFNNTYYYIFLLPYTILFLSFLIFLGRFQGLKLTIFLIFLISSLFSDYKYLINPHKTEFKKATEYLSNEANKDRKIYTIGCDVGYVINYYFKLDKSDFDVKCSPLAYEELKKTDFLIVRNEDDFQPSFMELQKEFYGLSIYKNPSKMKLRRID